MGAVVAGIVLGFFASAAAVYTTWRRFTVQGVKDLLQKGEQVDGLTVNWRRWGNRGDTRRLDYHGCTLQFSAKGKVIVCMNYTTETFTYSRFQRIPPGQYVSTNITYDPNKLERFGITDELKSLSEISLCIYYLVTIIILVTAIAITSALGNIAGIISFWVILVLGESFILFWMYGTQSIEKVGLRLDAIINDAGQNGATLIQNQGLQQGGVQMYYTPTVQQPQMMVGQPVQQPMQMQPQQQQYYYAQQQGQPMMMQAQQPMGYAMQQSMQQQYMQPQQQVMQTAPQVEGVPSEYGTGERVAAAATSAYASAPVSVAASAPAPTTAGTTGGPYV